MAKAGESSRTNRRENDSKFSRKRKRKVGLVYDERMCKHDTPDGEDHPECPNRIRFIWEKLQLAGVDKRCVVLGGSKAEDKDLQLVHSKDHVNLVKSLSTKKKDSRRNKIASELDSIYLNGGSSEAAYLSAGSVVEVAEKVAQDICDSFVYSFVLMLLCHDFKGANLVLQLLFHLILGNAFCGQA